MFSPYSVRRVGTMKVKDCIMASFTSRARQSVDDVRASSGKNIVIFIVCGVVLSVSLLSCVTYIGLMGNVFPNGLFKSLCYVGAFANFVLMCALLWGKFVWFRPGIHEYASWGVNLLEIIVCIMNLVLAYQLAHGGADSLQQPMLAWYLIAPISPVFSMVGALVLIITSNDLKRKHNEMIVIEEKEKAEQELSLEQHRAQIEVKRSYVDYISTEMANFLSSPETQRVIAQHARHMVGQTMSGISGIAVAPQMETIIEAAPSRLPQTAPILPQPAQAPQPIAPPAPQAQPRRAHTPPHGRRNRGFLQSEAANSTGPLAQPAQPAQKRGRGRPRKQ